MIYGYVMTAVVGYTVDMIMAGNPQSSQVLIVTHDLSLIHIQMCIRDRIPTGPWRP